MKFLFYNNSPAGTLTIIITCYRVISADGSFTGYGGWPDKKQYLPELEGAAVS